MDDFRMCVACGMPLQKKEDFAGGDENCDFCIYCANADGTIKKCQEIFDGGVEFFRTVLRLDKEEAERATRKNMKTLAYWKGEKCACLAGEEMDDKEFAGLLQKLK